MRSAAAVLCLAAVAVTGCGAAPTDSSQDFDGDKRAVAVVIEDLETTARKADPGKKICEKLLSARLQDTLKKQGTNCATAVKEAVQDTDSFALTVDEVTVSGTKATAKVTSGEGSKQKTDTLELERDGAAWRIAALGG